MRKVTSMKTLNFFIVLLLSLSMTQPVYGESKKVRIFVVSSYHREYLWSQDTHAGVCAALIDFDFLDDERQVKEYTENDYVESSKVIVKKVWMDSKRKNTMKEIAGALIGINIVIWAIVHFGIH